MLKSFFSRFRENLSVYLCCLVNLALALRGGGLDWLHWLAVGLCLLSLALCLWNAVQEWKEGPHA